MIRIDEIYENTFLPWVRKNLPTTSIFYCDPFGRSDPESILCRGLENSMDEQNLEQTTNNFGTSYKEN